ncbi:MAG TPA: hypothetical protein VF233_01120 [Nitrososphaeraceae archaeon]
MTDTFALINSINPSNTIFPYNNDNCPYAIYSIIIDSTIPVAGTSLSIPLQFLAYSLRYVRNHFSKVAKPDPVYDHYINRSSIRRCG